MSADPPNPPSTADTAATGGDRLDLVLASVGRHLLTETERGAPGAAAHRGRRPRGLVLGVAAAVVLVLAAILAVAPARSALASWLGVGTTRVRVEPVPSAAIVSSITDGLTPVDRATAEEVLGRELPDFGPTDLGRPTSYAAMPEGGVLLVWPDATTLWIHPVSLDLSAVSNKVVPSSSLPEPVADLGDEALLFAGEHLLATPHRTVTATASVVWVSGQWELRLEADLPADALVVVARQLDRRL